MRYAKIYLFLLSLCSLLAPLLLSLWFSLCPQYGNPQCPTSANTSAALLAFRNADPTLISIFLTVNTIVPYVYPVSYIALGFLSIRKYPILALIGMIFGWFGSIAWGVIAAAEFVYYDASHLLDNTDATTLLNSIYLHWQIYYIVAAGWVVGHLFGYVILGIALLKSRAIARWASWLFIICAPLLGPIAYGLNNGWLQVVGYVLVFIASVPVAISLLRRGTSLPLDLNSKPSG